MLSKKLYFNFYEENFYRISYNHILAKMGQTIIGEALEYRIKPTIEIDSGMIWKQNRFNWKNKSKPVVIGITFNKSRRQTESDE